MALDELRMLESLADMAASQLELRRLRKSMPRQRGAAAPRGKADSCEKWPRKTDLRHALEQREFVLYYQPEVELGNTANCRPGSPDPLGSSRARACSAHGLHSAGRRERDDFADRRLGTFRGLQPDSEVVPSTIPPISSLRVCVNLSARQFSREGPGRPRGGAAAAVRRFKPATWSGDDRVEPDSGHEHRA